MLYLLINLICTFNINYLNSHLLHKSTKVGEKKLKLHDFTLVANAVSSNYIDFTYYISLFENMPIVAEIYTKYQQGGDIFAEYIDIYINAIFSDSFYHKKFFKNTNEFNDLEKISAYITKTSQTYNKMKQEKIFFSTYKEIINRYIDDYIEKNDGIFNAIFGILLERIIHKSYDRQNDILLYKKCITSLKKLIEVYNLQADGINEKINYSDNRIYSQILVDFFQRLSFASETQRPIMITNLIKDIDFLKNNYSLIYNTYHFTIENGKLKTYIIEKNRLTNKNYVREIKNIYLYEKNAAELLKKIDKCIKKSYEIKVYIFSLAKTYYNILMNNTDDPIILMKTDVVFNEINSAFLHLLTNRKVDINIKNSYIRAIFQYIYDEFAKNINFTQYSSPYYTNEQKKFIFQFFNMENVDFAYFLTKNIEVTDDFVNNINEIWLFTKKIFQNYNLK